MTHDLDKHRSGRTFSGSNSGGPFAPWPISADDLLMDLRVGLPERRGQSRCGARLRQTSKGQQITRDGFVDAATSERLSFRFCSLEGQKVILVKPNRLKVRRPSRKRKNSATNS